MTNQPGELGAAIERVSAQCGQGKRYAPFVRIGDLRLVLSAIAPTHNDAGDVERMRAERDEARAITKRVQSSAKTIMIGEADELLKLREEKRGEWLASKTLDSEREANAILTEENATLRAAFSALSQKGGWQLAPVEPTPEMLNAAVDRTGAGNGMSWANRSPQGLFETGYLAMLAAAPVSAPHGGDEK